MNSILKTYNERKNCVIGMLLLMLVMSMLFAISAIKMNSEKISELEMRVNESYQKGWDDGAQRGFEVGVEGGYEIGYKNATLNHVDDFYDGFEEGLGKPREVRSLENYSILFYIKEKRVEYDLNLSDFASIGSIFALAYYCEDKNAFNRKPLELRDQCYGPRYITYNPDNTEDY